MPGLDSQDALARLGGNQTLYLQMLRRFLELEAAPEQISEQLSRGDWLTAERLAHTLKGVAGSLGAGQLQKIAAELELALRKRVESQALLTQLREALVGLITPLRAGLPPESPPAQETGDPEQVVAEMDALLGRFDAAAPEFFEAHREVFRARLSEADFSAFAEHLAHFALDEAHRLLSSGSRLLIVEDAPANIEALKAILGQQGFQISSAGNGRQALSMLASVRPELILLDVMMPQMDGFETCALLKANPEWRDIPVIFLTGKTETSDIVRGFELGAVDYVAKPFHAHELLARVNTHLKMDRLRRENERLVRAESEMARHRSVAEMVAGVAHEINTPLGIINTAAGLLHKWVSSPVLVSLAETADGQMLVEDLTDASRLITRNAARAHKLLQDFKKVSVHQITDIREKAMLAEVVKETVHLFQVTARTMEVEIHDRLPAGQGEWLGYPGSLSQVLLNLLSNAQRYAYPERGGGKVDITLTLEGERFRLVVRDFGRGIPPQNLPRIFDPFFTTGRAQGGSGLGMSIVHTIVVDHMKGAITIDSAVGQGTTVTLGLPREVSE